MATLPEYSYDLLKKTIPKANLKEIKEINLIIKNDVGFYSVSELRDLLMLVTKRLIELSNQICP